MRFRESMTPVERLQQERENAGAGEGSQRSEQQHKKGRLTARERIGLLLDVDSFEEIDRFVVHDCNEFDMQERKIAGDGVVVGRGCINGRQVYVFAKDFTVLGGSLSLAHSGKITKVQDLALEQGVPIIGLYDSGGARIQEGVAALAGYGDVFYRNVEASGVIPQISVIMGACAGGDVYSPALTDFIFMVRDTSYMFVTGPDVVETVMNEKVTTAELGGADVHCSKSGVADGAFDDDIKALRQVRRFFDFLPLSNRDEIPKVENHDSPDRCEEILDRTVPADTSLPYDVKHIIEKLVDNGDFFELQAAYAPNIVIGFARMGGSTVGIVANQPKVLAGVLDCAASAKAARFVRFCDCYNIPIVTLVDVPGFLPGTDQEYAGLIKHGAKLLYSYAEATTPKITVILRKGFGGAYVVMASKHLGADVNFAWPGAEIAVMGAEAAVKIIYRRETSEERREKLLEDYKKRFLSPFVAAQRGYLDDVIMPRNTRRRVISALGFLSHKRSSKAWKKHGNIPL